MVEREIKMQAKLSRQELGEIYRRLEGARIVQRCEMLIHEGGGLKAENLGQIYISSAKQQGIDFRVDQFAATAHTQVSNDSRRVLAVRLVTDRVFDVEPIGTVTMSEASVRCWINARFLTLDEAAQTEYAGRTALAWARDGRNGEEVKRVVKAANGYFYACDEQDITLQTR